MRGFAPCQSTPKWDIPLLMDMDAQTLVKSWLNGRASVALDQTLLLAPRRNPRLREKYRRAYYWISEHVIHAAYNDMEFGAPVAIGQGDHRVELYGGDCFSSFILLPLLTLMTSRRMVFVGAPGRGKTSVATLMALLAGHTLKETRHSIQHGHPQLTIADLLGSPLPRDLIRAERTQDVQVSWRNWIQMRVKIQNS